MAGAAAVVALVVSTVALVVSTFVAGLGGRVLGHLDDDRDGLAGLMDLVGVGDPFDAVADLDFGLRFDAVDGAGWVLAWFPEVIGVWMQVKVH
ncbi:hypothetical protein [Mycobacterium riyadhense]|uniref:hypothetical protein n=1 Tax=Mycobacterium riyadhense TaxID=486698 RepID=UPI00195B5CAB|nr:hypothetical protein [Mycobacterium riyadhense]